MKTEVPGFHPAFTHCVASVLLSKGSLWDLVLWGQQTLKIETKARGHTDPTVKAHGLASQTPNRKDRELPILGEPGLLGSSDSCFRTDPLPYPFL